ncbi:MAG: ferredoxin family protein [Tannerellaceae bacterium]|nr:ferredoxin family protein [Tannerellaceae bacterium]
MTTCIILTCVALLVILLSYFRNKRAKNKVIHIIADRCTGCRRCVKTCRRKALEPAKDKESLHPVLKYPEKCTACKDCILVCKFHALELVNRNVD